MCDSDRGAFEDRNFHFVSGIFKSRFTVDPWDAFPKTHFKELTASILRRNLQQYLLMPRPNGSLGQRVILHIIFLLSGITTVLIGQVLPILARHFTLSDLQVSYFFPAQFAGSLAGTFLTSHFARRDNYFTATLIGTIMMAAGMLMMNVDAFSVCLLGFTVNGIGIGLTLPSINMLILEMSRERAGSALNVLNFCWGVGAIVCKPFVDLFGTHDQLGLTTYLLAVPLLAMSAALMLMGGAREQKRSDDPADASSDTTPIWTTKIAWLIALFNFIHVGFESGIGGWLTTYAERVPGEPITNWISPTLLYFSFFVLGRGFAPVLFRFLNENRMLLLGLSIVLLGMGVIQSASSVLALSLGATLAGFGTSWLFPTNVARFSHTFGPTATRRATPLFICGTLGAASSTWLIGFVSDQTGSLHSGMYVLLAAAVMLLVLQIGLSLRKPAAA